MIKNYFNVLCTTNLRKVTRQIYRKMSVFSPDCYSITSLLIYHYKLCKKWTSMVSKIIFVHVFTNDMKHRLRSRYVLHIRLELYDVLD